MFLPDVHVFPFALPQTSNCSTRVRPGLKSAPHGELSFNSTSSAPSSPSWTSSATPSRTPPPSTLPLPHSTKSTASCDCALHHCVVCSRTFNDALAPLRLRNPLTP